MLELTLPEEYENAEWVAVFARVTDFMTAAYGLCGSVSLLVTDNNEIRRLNRDFRGIDRETDVLSFPAGEEYGNEEATLGDIAISLPRAEAQAEEYGHSLERELAFLTVHGMLHLLGYDHIEAADEARMRQEQTKILTEMGIER